MSLDFSKIADAFNTAKEAVARGEAAIAELADSHESQIQALVVELRGLEEQIERLTSPGSPVAPAAPVAAAAEALPAAEPTPEATLPAEPATPQEAAESSEPEAPLDPTGSHPIVQAATAAAGGGDVTVSPGVAEAGAASSDPASQPTDGNAEPGGSEAGS